MKVVAQYDIYLNEHYIGILDNNGTVSVERYNNNGARPSSAFNAAENNKWIPGNSTKVLLMISRFTVVH